MARKKKNPPTQEIERTSYFHDLEEETVRVLFAIVFFVLATLLALAAFELSGVLGSYIFKGLSYLFGIGYYIMPALLFTLSVSYLFSLRRDLRPLRVIGSIVFFIASLGMIEMMHAGSGGIAGTYIARPLVALVDVYATVLLLGSLMLISLLVILETHLLLAPAKLWSRIKEAREQDQSDEDEPVAVTAPLQPPVVAEPEEAQEKDSEDKNATSAGDKVKQFLGFGEKADGAVAFVPDRSFNVYTPPPVSLLEKDRGKPGVGDIKANANIIKRTLQNFGITVDMDEISIGPTVTRYALKPAEGVRISKIVSLQSNLELALAASPIRIEAPIPGKSLVGIEVPNTAKTTLGLASLLGADEFVTSPKSLLVALGRNITGTPYYADIAKMPHSLIAGATGAGKSVSVHGIITSLLYRNGPEKLRLILVDPKRVELTSYNGIPHLLTPVITDPKKAILALKWATKEMERRYDVLETEQVRDIHSYHTNILTPALTAYAERAKKADLTEEDESRLPEQMPYIVVIIDELADLMSSYPRELEASIVRLAQMSRAVGIHLLLSTQRPSVNVITGLIKANVPTRLALQVASQIDSRTILDSAGAEKLLGAGDTLYLSAEMAKPVRLQAPYISENEVKNIVQFIKKHNDYVPEAGIDLSSDHVSGAAFSASIGNDDDNDDLYEEAKVYVIEAKRASTSYLQRKLRIGYARAARLMDMLEERGVIGPQDGAKPREVIHHGSSDDAASPDEGSDYTDTPKLS